MEHREYIKIFMALLACVGFCMTCFAQIDTSSRNYPLGHVYYRKDSSTIFLYFINRTGCKSFFYDSISVHDPRTVDGLLLKDKSKRGKGAPTPLLKVHGNIAYTYDYRSQLDTPFAGTNVQIHNEQVYADATVRGKYPFRIILHSQQSNSPYFRNYTDVNVEFKHQDFQRAVKNQMIAEMTAQKMAGDSLNKYEQQLNAQRSKYQALETWVNDPSRSQDIVQDKEKIYQQAMQLGEQQAGKKLAKDTVWGVPMQTLLSKYPNLNQAALEDSLKARLIKQQDSVLKRLQKPTSTEDSMQGRKKQADSLKKLIAGLKGKQDSAHAQLDSTIDALAKDIRNARSISELEEAGKKAGTGALSKSDKALLGITHFNIGRSAANYSDLTVNNVSLTGMNIEYNPSWYGAFAIGTVDYSFRDFLTQAGSMPRQNLVLGRVGWGDKNKRIFVFTVYTGTKNSLGGTTSSSSIIPPSPAVASTPVLGYSLAVLYKIDSNKNFSFEAAKSSTPYVPGGGSGKSFNQAFAFSQRNNEAYTAKFQLYVPYTHSKFDMFFTEVGANFQSYSIFSSGTRQEGWGIRWQQPFFRNQLSVTAQVKKNIFDDPLLSSGYSSSMVLKSLQVVYRKRKWPVFTAGIMPSTQLIKAPTGTLTENIYYALTGTALYSYSVQKLRMSSSLMYSQFFNHGTDSGFVFYDAKNVLYSQQVYWGKLTTQTDVQYSIQPGLEYWMLQQGMTLNIGNYVTIGATAKRDLVAGSSVAYWGEGGQVEIRFKKVGSLRMQYSKDYLPNGTNGLSPYNWGRANWIKVF